MIRFVALLLAIVTLGLSVQARAEPQVYIDQEGVMRWRKDDSELRLFGANYCGFSGSDYRMAGLVHADRKAMIDADMAHFSRMGWDGMRLCSWGDWENADGSGNLILNDHSDLMDYLISKAHQHGITILLTPIHTYDPRFADQLKDGPKPPGFSGLYPRANLGTDRTAIAAERNYITQLLNHRNPYTGLALKDDPAIPMVEMINEPVHHPENLPGSIAYIDGLVDSVRSSGSNQVTFFNYSQDFRIGEAIRQSSVDGVDFGWYPSGLGAGRTLKGNFLQAVDHYPDLLRPEVAKRPRIVYEFDPADLNGGVMLPAMARTFRSVGAQFAAIFAYDMLPTAPFNLGWQTHFINLVHTPRQAVSAVIAAEAMRRLPRFQDYGNYPETLRFGDFRINYDNDSSELAATDAYMNAGDSTTPAPSPATLRRIVGFGSSPLVGYEGTGSYFLDKIEDGLWRLEVYPDQIMVADPFAQPQLGKVVSRLYSRSWPIAISLPDLGGQYFATPIHLTGAAQQAQKRIFAVQPGIWLLSRAPKIDAARLPAQINHVGLKDFFVNPPQTYPDLILTQTPDEFVTGSQITIRVRAASATLPDSLTLFIRPSGTINFGRTLQLPRTRGDEYAVSLNAGDLGPGFYDYVVTDGNLTFPGAVAGRPGVWPFSSADVWHFHVTAPDKPLELFNPARDAKLLSFARPDEDHRGAHFRLLPGETGESVAFSFGLPDLGAATPELYAAALYIGDRIAARGASAAKANALTIRFRAIGGTRKTLDLTLIEKDGSGWRGSFVAGPTWSSAEISLDDLRFSRSLFIPTPFPGLWDYWRNGPAARANSHISPVDVERLELKVSRNDGDDASFVEISSVNLTFSPTP